MRHAASILSAVLLCAQALGTEQDASPHRMLGANGAADPAKCAVCHREDMSLHMPKAQLCTTCHGPAPHAGAGQHLAADAARVRRVLGDTARSPQLPLTDEGTIYCGTCHFFHDPRVSGEAHQPSAWVPADTGLAEAVRRSLRSRWKTMERSAADAAPLARFARESTTALRLAVGDGALCTHCHKELP